MRSKMKWIAWLPAAALLTSCASNDSPSASQAAANRSALYDPPTVTLRPGGLYEFLEGTLVGTGQRFHSDYSYRRAIIIGAK